VYDQIAIGERARATGLTRKQIAYSIGRTPSAVVDKYDGIGFVTTRNCEIIYDAKLRLMPFICCERQ
jgi:hypothetical protein